MSEKGGKRETRERKNVYLVSLVDLVCFVGLVCLVCLDRHHYLSDGSYSLCEWNLMLRIGSEPSAGILFAGVM